MSGPGLVADEEPRLVHDAAAAVVAPTPRRRRRALEWALVVLVIALGTWLRATNLAITCCWVDEAESCLNGLTILDRGLPRSEYLGLPIYENTLTEPWPESAEYEFKDSSYSKQGLAVYHGWLPLYAIAAAYAIAGVEPDRVPETLAVQHSPEEMTRRTLVGRIPSVLFGVLTMLFLFLAGDAMYGRDMAFGALLAGAFARPTVVLARQARYYSATVAFGVLVAFAIWQLVRRGRTRDWALAALAFVLLFHTHVLTFAVGCAVLALALPAILRDRTAWRRLAGFSVAVMAGTLPWLLATGFLGQASDVPKGFSLLDLPGDLAIYPRSKLPFLAIAIPGFVALVVARTRRERMSPAFVHAFTADRGAGFLLVAWVAIAYVAFTLTAPAASLFLQRTTIPLAGPAILFGALVLAAFARAVHARSAFVVGPALSLSLALALSGEGWDWMYGKTESRQAFVAAEALRDLGPFEPGTRFYATPNEHLPLTLYTGLPVQSVAPVRKSFLDEHPHDVVVIETLARYEPLAPSRLATIAREAGVELTRDESVALRKELSLELVARDVAALDVVLETERPDLPEWTERALREQRAANPEAIRRKKDPEEDNPAMFHGFTISTWLDWWPVFFYRFVDPLARMGTMLNYAERIRGSRAYVLSTTWVVYVSPGRGVTTEPADR